MTTLIVAIFIIGYAGIAFEHTIGLNKAATALLTGVICWTVYILAVPDKQLVVSELTDHMGELSGILFFLLGAMTIVELIDAHDGFDIITSRINQTDQRKLLWIISFITFFLSAVLDNLTATIVMVSFLRKLVKHKDERLFFAGMIVIAANAGGAWSPIGDVTTTMLWIGGQITPVPIIMSVLVPSLVCLVVPLVFLSIKLKGHIEPPVPEDKPFSKILPFRHRAAVFYSGLGVLLFVPVFKGVTHLPPYMGILLGLGVLWVITEVMHGKKDQEDKHTLSVVYALRKIDAPSILFFLGILLSIAALQSSGILTSAAGWMTSTIGNENVIVAGIGILSSVVDNVPLVAAVQGMYHLTDYPPDHQFWHFLAYCAGTGGSILIIGSAAGVAAMGLEKIDFFWYIRRVSALALMGYFSGAVVHLFLMNFVH